jgi:hypothetical protein
MSATRDVSIKRLILVPAVITLAITLLRLVGELFQWSPAFFSREAGGAGALVGIVWLVPVFGMLFALKLAKSGQGPAGAGRALGLCLLGFALVPVAGVVSAQLGVSQQSFTIFAIFVVASIVGGVIAFRAWPALGRVLFAYGLAARIPVVLVMLVAILGNWGTHYDVAPPDFPEMNVFAKWFLIGVLPQLTIWIWFTIAVGGIFGSALIATRGKRAAPSA